MHVNPGLGPARSLQRLPASTRHQCRAIGFEAAENRILLSRTARCRLSADVEAPCFGGPRRGRGVLLGMAKVEALLGDGVW